MPDSYSALERFAVSAAECAPFTRPARLGH